MTTAGTFYVVTVKTWFEAETISQRRPLDIPLCSNPCTGETVDAAGRRFAPSLPGQKAVDGNSVPLTQLLTPGQSYETKLVFDLPAGVDRPRLLVAGGVSRESEPCAPRARPRA